MKKILAKISVQLGSLKVVDRLQSLKCIYLRFSKRRRYILKINNCLSRKGQECSGRIKTLNRFIKIDRKLTFKYSIANKKINKSVS